jgi:hypothetical protein
MKQKIRRISYLAAAVLIALVLSVFYAPPTRAESLSDSFIIKFDPVVYDHNEVAPGEAFQAIFKGHAECNKTLPLPVSEATITAQIVAKDTAGGAEVILNPEFSASINPFPHKQGETYDLNETIPLQFPAGTAPGQYRVTCKFLEAKGRVLIWIDMSSYLPGDQDMGTIQCVLPGSSSETTATLKNPAPAQSATSLTSTTPVTETTTPPSSSALLPPAPSKEGWKSFFSWWMILVIVVAVIAIFLIFIYGFRRRE